jgi:hypothetical protein
MVLKNKPTNQGVRFIIGICIIAVSIYIFYIAMAKKNSPELFVLPADVAPREYACSQVLIGGHTVCIPSEINYSLGPPVIEIFSEKTKIRGTIQVMDELPLETKWRESLHTPLIQAFLGDIDSMNTFDLMKTILDRRYNPTLMGVKAELIPPWMNNNKQAAIIVPEGQQAIGFYTRSQFLGLVFSGQDIVMLSFVGYMDKVLAASIMRSVGTI